MRAQRGNFSSLSDNTKKDNMEEVTFGLILEKTVKQERAREQLERRFHKDMKFTEQTKENSKECRDSKYKK